jgi:hypothetical protein
MAPCVPANLSGLQRQGPLGKCFFGETHALGCSALAATALEQANIAIQQRHGLGAELGHVGVAAVILNAVVVLVSPNTVFKNPVANTVFNTVDSTLSPSAKRPKRCATGALHRNCVNQFLKSLFLGCFW